MAVVIVGMVACSGVSDGAQSQGGAGGTPPPREKSFVLAANTVEFERASYSLSQSDGSVTLVVNRGIGSVGPATVRYSTGNLSASSGDQYTGAKGTIAWAQDDSRAQTIVIPVHPQPPFAGLKTFTVVLSDPAPNTQLGTLRVATVAISGVSPGRFGVSVQGSHLVDAQGAPLQLRGVNASALETVAIQGWSAGDPWGGQAPNWDAIKSWKANAVRLPLNEGPWLGHQCKDPKTGEMRSTDPGHNYVATVIKTVQEATDAGLYVILDLHWNAPGPYCPRMQAPMADADNSIEFWTSVAQIFKGQRNVLFELFNEPFITKDNHSPVNGNIPKSWPYLMSGSDQLMFSGFNEADAAGGWNDMKYPWQIASMQSMLTAIRATGAANVIIVGAQDYSQELDGWLGSHPVDPIKQMAAAWHAYPKFGAAFGTPDETQPNYYPEIYTQAQGILDAGFPILITEIGEVCTPGTPNAPEVTNVTRWADAHLVSVFGWTWDTWYSPTMKQCANVLIQDRNGTPTPGYGKVFHDWMVGHP